MIGNDYFTFYILCTYFLLFQVLLSSTTTGLDEMTRVFPSLTRDFGFKSGHENTIVLNPVW